MEQQFKLDNLYFETGEKPLIEIKDNYKGNIKINNQNIYVEESGNPFIVMDKASKLFLTNTNIKRLPKGHIEYLETNNKKLKDKHHKATNKVTELVKENKKLKETVLLQEENSRQKEKFWVKRKVELEEMLYRLEDKISKQPDTRSLEAERYTYKAQKEQIEKELKETQEDNLVYYDILSTLLNDPEQVIDIYMQGRRRGQLDEWTMVGQNQTK